MSGNRERKKPECFPTMKNKMDQCAKCSYWTECLEIVLEKGTNPKTRDRIRQFMNQLRDSKIGELIEW